MTTSHFELEEPPKDIISAIEFAPTSHKLLVSSWDRNVYLYDSPGNGCKLLNTFAHSAPILGACFSGNDDVAFTNGLDGHVRTLDLQSGAQNTLSIHPQAGPVLAFSAPHNLLISACWEPHTLHVHALSHPNLPASRIPLPAKPFAICVSASKLIVAMSTRLLHIYSLADLGAAAASSRAAPSDAKRSAADLPTLALDPWQKRESSLKFQARAVAAMPSDDGYASASIEGRVAVEWFDPSGASQARNYAFKCHRQPSTQADEPTLDVVYPVNRLAFHPVHGTFASGGGDGVVALWDALAKRRIRQYQRYATNVSALAFHPSDGRWLAVGLSWLYKEGEQPGPEDRPRIFVRELGENEAKGKGPK